MTSERKIPTPPLHPWNLDPSEAHALQLRLRQELVHTWNNRPVRSVGGVDLGYSDWKP